MDQDEITVRAVETLRDAVDWWHSDIRNMEKKEPAWLPAARALLSEIRQGA